MQNILCFYNKQLTNVLPENKYVRFSAIKDVLKMENKDV